MKKLSALMLAAFMGCSAVSARQGDTPSEGFHTDGLRILDAKNNEFVMRGVNYSYAWQRGHEETVIPRAKELGCNAIRIQLSTGRRRDLNIPETERPDVGQKCTREDVEKLIRLCEANNLVCVLNTHDETGYDGEDWLASAVDYWLSMKDLLNAHRKTVIVNVSNEWFGSWNSWGWKDGYVNQIPRLREGGLKNMLIVDCAGWGQYPQSVLDGGDAVYESDPDRNLAFSVHFYDYAGASDQDVEYTMWNLTHQLHNSVPLIAGEFSYEHMGRHVSWQKILSYSYDRKIGYFAWSWTDNGGGAEACDLFVAGDYEGKTFATNGKAMFLSRYGIEDTSRECSIFDDAVPANCPDYNVFREGAPHEDYPLNGITGEGAGETGGSGGETGGSGSGDDYDPSLEEPLPDETSKWVTDVTIADNIDCSFDGSWGNSYHVKPEQLGALRKGDKIHLYFSNTGGGSQLQVAYMNGSTWTELHSYKDINNATQEDIEVKNSDSHPKFIRGVNSDGIYVKGQNYTLDRVSVTRREDISLGIDNARVDGAEMFDFEAPFEIYTIDGRRVGEMLPGVMYILRQGSTVKKYIAR